MFLDIKVPLLFGFVDDEQKDEGQDLEQAIFLFLKVEDLHLFMQRYQFFYPKLRLGIGFLKTE